MLATSPVLLRPKLRLPDPGRGFEVKLRPRKGVAREDRFQRRIRLRARGRRDLPVGELCQRTLRALRGPAREPRPADFAGAALRTEVLIAPAIRLHARCNRSLRYEHGSDSRENTVVHTSGGPAVASTIRDERTTHGWSLAGHGGDVRTVDPLLDPGSGVSPARGPGFQASSSARRPRPGCARSAPPPGGGSAPGGARTRRPARAGGRS